MDSRFPFVLVPNPSMIQFYMGDEFPGPFIHSQSPNPITSNCCTENSQSTGTSHTSRSSNRNFHYSQFPKDVNMHHLGKFSGQESAASALQKSSSCIKEVNESKIQDAACKHMQKHSRAYVPLKLSRCSSFKWNVISLKPLDPVHARLDDSLVRTRSLSASSLNGRPAPRLLYSPNQKKSNTLHHNPKKCNECKENEHPEPKPDLQDGSQSRIQGKAENRDKRNRKSRTSGYLHSFFIFKAVYEFLFWKTQEAESTSSGLMSGHARTTSCHQKRQTNPTNIVPACTRQKEEQNNGAGIRAAIEHCKQQSHGGHIVG